VEAPVTALTRFLFDAVYAPRSAWSIIGWWEGRRTAFNLAVGGTGIVTLVAVNVLSLLPPGGSWFGVPLLPIAAYGLAANLCYTAGPVADLLIRRLWGHGYAAVGPALFRYGFAFSLGLTLLPIPIALVAWVARLVLGG
jgi:hypothetical protein